MPNNSDNITVSDFENICRTCLSREDLKLLYNKCFASTCLVDMLMSCTSVKFSEDDGLPVKICTNCIHEINQAFLFTKRCETTDAILRKCANIKTELSNTSSQLIKAEKEIYRTEQFLGIYEYVAVNAKIKDEAYLEPVIQKEDVQLDVKQEEELIIENESGENCNDSADESYEEDFDSEDFDNSGSRPRQKLHVCSVCSKAFTLKQKLKSHMSRHNRAKLYSCVTCGKSFTSSSDLVRHKRTHTGKKPNVCSVCSKAFIQTITLKQHMRIHTGEKPYSCEICGKSYTVSGALIRHKRTHTGEKQNVCSVCSKGFIQSSTLKRHMRLHTGEKFCSCVTCGKSFNSNSDLTKHKRIHTGEKPYLCSICNKAFAQSSNFNDHMRTHTGEKPYSCQTCGKNFTLNSYLSRHKRNLHS